MSCQRAFPGDAIGALTRPVEISGTIRGIEYGPTSAKLFVEFSFYMTYAIQTPLNRNYRWGAWGEIRTTKQEEGLYKIDEIYAKHEDEYILDLTDTLD